MKKTLISIAVLGMVVSGSAMAFDSGSGSAMGGAISGSAASSSSNGNGSSYQVSSASAANQTGVSVQTNDHNGVAQVDLVTYSTGTTLTTNYGETTGTGTGDSIAGAAQGGAAQAEGQAGAGKGDSFHTGWGTDNHAGGGGRVSAESMAAQGTVSGGIQVGNGESLQYASGSAINASGAKLVVKPKTQNGYSGIHMTGETYTAGSTLVTASGYNDSAFGGSGGMAIQGGSADLSAGGSARMHDVGYDNGWNVANGRARVSMKASVEGGSSSSAGGLMNHNDGGWSGTSAVASQEAGAGMITPKYTSTAYDQYTYARDTTVADTDTGTWGTGGANAEAAAKARQSAIAGGSVTVNY